MTGTPPQGSPVPDLPTPPSLLERLREPDPGEAWGRFVKLYAPLLLLWLRKLDVPESDREDVAQEVFAVLAKQLPDFTYDPARRFRGYLFRITQGRAADRRRKLAAAAGSPGSLPADHPAADDPAAEVEEAEYRGYLVRRAMTVMQAEFEPQTWQAFWGFVVDERPADEVAAELGLSADSVYQAKKRVLRRLHRELDGLLD